MLFSLIPNVECEHALIFMVHSRILEEAGKAAEAGNYQWLLQLTDIILDAKDQAEEVRIC